MIDKNFLEKKCEKNNDFTGFYTVKYFSNLTSYAFYTDLIF